MIVLEMREEERLAILSALEEAGHEANYDTDLGQGIESLMHFNDGFAMMTLRQLADDGNEIAQSALDVLECA